MARIRTIKPEFFTSDDICALSPRARLLYIGLWCEADREGRLVWSPTGFKRRYLPDDECNVTELCKELTDRGLVKLYGDGLAFIPTFGAHQHVNPREAASKLPAPPDDDASRRVSDASSPVSDRQVGRKGTEGREGVRTQAPSGLGSNPAATSPPVAPRASAPDGPRAVASSGQLRLSGASTIWTIRLLSHRPGERWPSEHGPAPESDKPNLNLDDRQRREWRLHHGLPADWKVKAA